MEHLDLLKANGVTVENLKDLTNETLAEFGMKKFMHRKRFLRYSGEMHRKLETDLTEEEKKDLVIASAETEDDRIALLRKRSPLSDNGATGFVCENYTCQLPTDDLSEFKSQIDKLMEKKK